MTLSFTGRKRLRKNFGKIQEIAQMPNLIEVQRTSYDQFLQLVKGDGRKDAVVKREIFDREIRDNWRIVGVFDDRQQVVRMWRALGLTVFQVAEGDF